MDNQALVEKIRQMAPWHHDIEINDDVSTGKVFSPDGCLPKQQNQNVTLISPRAVFSQLLKGCYPDTMQDASFLDCACNGGAYCFLAREYGASRVVGFDIREHWIEQAKFVQQHRTFGPVDKIDFQVMDLYDLPKQDHEQFDFTYFSGIFYHLPDPITGLKIAADLTKDIIYVSTSGKSDPSNPTGLSMTREHAQKPMSGAYELAWFPNGVECLQALLTWLGFKDIKLLRLVENPNNRIRMSIVAAREEGRLEHVTGEQLATLRLQSGATRPNQ